jgi:hypothetical protein
MLLNPINYEKQELRSDKNSTICSLTPAENRRYCNGKKKEQKNYCEKKPIERQHSNCKP